MSERELEEASVMKPEEVDIGLNTESNKIEGTPILKLAMDKR